MAVTTNSLQAVVVFEKDVNDDVMSWSFPQVDSGDSNELRTVLESRSGLREKGSVDSNFRFSRFQNCWQYYLIEPISSEKNPRVTAVCIVVLSKTYFPEKYQELLKIFYKLYAQTMSPMPIMQAYLSVFTTNKLSGAAGDFDESKFDARRALVSPVCQAINTWGVGSVVMWVAMLLKKRIFVYAKTVDELLPVVRSFPIVGAWHRQDWDILRPFCTLEAAELADLAKAGTYVAGFTDVACQARKDMYDVFFDISSKSLTIADHAKAAFMLCKFHQQAGEGFVKAAADGNDQAVIKAVHLKTKELLTNLESLKTAGEDGTFVRLEDLAAKKMPPNMDKFLYNVAVQENMTN